MRSTVIPRISLSFTAQRYTAALVKFSGSVKINGEIWSFFTYLSDVVAPGIKVPRGSVPQ